MSFQECMHLQVQDSYSPCKKMAGKICKRKIGQFTSRLEQDSWMSLHAKSDINGVLAPAVLYWEASDSLKVSITGTPPAECLKP